MLVFAYELYRSYWPAPMGRFHGTAYVSNLGDGSPRGGPRALPPDLQRAEPCDQAPLPQRTRNRRTSGG